MYPAALIPAPDAIPVPWGWFYILLVVTFVLHILVMNAMLGGGIIALLSTLKGGNENTQLCKEFSYKWPYTIALAINMGVAPLLFVQVLYGQFIYSSSILMAGWWLSIIAMLILAYYSAYIYDFKFDVLHGTRIFFLEFSVLMLMVTAFFFTNNMTLMLQPERWAAYLTNDGGTLLNLTDPTVIPRYLHFVTGAIAVAGLYLALIGHFNLRKSTIDKQILIRKGMRYFSLATSVQILLGCWFLFALPNQVMMSFMGGSAYGTVLLTLGIILALTALYFGYQGKLIAASGSTLILLTIMILMRDLVRIVYLKPYFSMADLSVKPEYSPLIFFLVVFVAGLAMIWYMLKLAFNCRKEVSK